MPRCYVATAYLESSSFIPPRTLSALRLPYLGRRSGLGLASQCPSQAPLPGSGSTSLEDCVRGWALTWQDGDLRVPGRLTAVPRRSPLGRARKGHGAHQDYS